MATVVRYALQYDGVRFFGNQAVQMLKKSADYYSAHGLLPKNPKLSSWQQIVRIFELLPDYGKKLVVVREPKRCRRSRYKHMIRKGVVL